jgi:endoglucanase
MVSPRARAAHEQWLLALTSLPTAAGREDAVIAWIERWAAARANVAMRRDGAGNVLITRARTHGSLRGGDTPRRKPPLYITAHLDHPAFVVRIVRGSSAVLEFRGGVHEPYFRGAALEIHDSQGQVHRASVVSIDTAARPFTRVTARLATPAGSLAPGDIGRWVFDGHEPLPRISDRTLHTHACDDLAGVAAALAAMDVLRRKRGMGHVALLFTRAEEVGFIGAIAACRAKWIPGRARLICLETSRSFPESPIGGGPIVRVGDRMSVFDPALTNAIGLLMTEYERTNPRFRWQRKLMPGGTCEATTFSAYGYQSTCLCLPLGNYHNMVDIDGVAAKRQRARVGPEFISVDDFHGLVEMLIVCATRLDAPSRPKLRERMEALMKKHGYVLRQPRG